MRGEGATKPTKHRSPENYTSAVLPHIRETRTAGSVCREPAPSLYWAPGQKDGQTDGWSERREQGPNPCPRSSEGSFRLSEALPHVQDPPLINNPHSTFTLGIKAEVALLQLPMFKYRDLTGTF